MNVQNKTHIQPLGPEFSSEDVISLLTLALGNPTPQKIQKILQEYAQTNHHFLGTFLDETLIALAGIQLNQKEIILKHIAVLRPFQHKGFGKALIRDILKRYSGHTLLAETDEEGKAFYDKCGFKLSSYRGPHGIRYRCMKEA